MTWHFWRCIFNATTNASWSSRAHSSQLMHIQIFNAKHKTAGNSFKYKQILLQKIAEAWKNSKNIRKLWNATWGISDIKSNFEYICIRIYEIPCQKSAQLVTATLCDEILIFVRVYLCMCAWLQQFCCMQLFKATPPPLLAMIFLSLAFQYLNWKPEKFSRFVFVILLSRKRLVELFSNIKFLSVLAVAMCWCCSAAALTLRKCIFYVNFAISPILRF